jgi:aminopeptidase-like protein
MQNSLCVIQRIVFILALLVLLKVVSLRAQIVKPLLDTKTQEALLNELSGERAKDFVIDISRFDRVQASDGLYRSMEMIKNKLAGFGISNTVIERFPSNSEIAYWTWKPPMGWRIRSAELWMTSPRKLKLADYSDIPTTVARGSQTTDVTAELIDVGRGTRSEDYQNRDVKGKILLAGGDGGSRFTGNVQREGVFKHGAVGVVSYLDPKLDGRLEFPDLVPYHAMWNSREENKQITFGFTISRHTAEMLKSMLARGEKVMLHAKVDGENYDSNVDQMMCTITGSQYPDEEVLLLGHLDHYQPGANDNASGSAGLLEMARGLKKMIDRGDLPAPKRTIRFLWVTEFNGTVPWLKAHPELWKKTIVAINCDMIGGDLVKTFSYFYFTRTPFSRPHYLNDVAENLTHHTASLDITSPRGNNSAPFNYRITPFSGGSDHWMLNDGSIGVPALMFGHPDPYHHTIQDVPDNIDPTEMKRVMFITLSSALYIANAESQQAVELGALVAANSMRDLGTAAAQVIATLNENSKDESSLYTALKEGLNRITWEAWRAQSVIRSVQELDAQKAAQTMIDLYTQQTGRYAKELENSARQVYQHLCATSKWTPREVSLTSVEKDAQKLVPLRQEVFTCPLEMSYLSEKVGSSAVANIGLDGDVLWEIGNFMDGNNSVLDIRNAVSAEFGPQPLEKVVNFVRLLEQAKLVSIKR